MNLSEPQLISPMLDGFVMGDPISNHDGVRACPAMHLASDKKYIVKIISLPATQSKLDALLLAGAFTDHESALAYFKELADGVVEEAALLQKLSRHEGFLAFENWQLMPMDEGETGFDIYLLSQYRPTLEGILQNNEMTHLQAINLGLDLCAALSASRRYGHLYSNLRPSNIYLYNEREFRIGDLGFLSLESLPYTSLPDKYRSDYTPPEINDAFSTLNDTMDTYAVGLILYQAYNDGRLPVVGMALNAPRHADSALAEIILKACAADPAERWQDPVQMGQALANYMQSDSVNDTPIVPPPAEEEIEEPEPIFPDEDTEPSTADILAEVDDALESAPPIVPAPQTNEESAVVIEEVAAEEDPIAEEESAVEELTEQGSAPVEADIAEEASVIDESNDEQCIVEESTEEASEDAVSEEAPLDEMAQMLAQADELIAHQLPDPPVAPEAIEVTLPFPEEEIVEEPTLMDPPIAEIEVEEPQEDTASDNVVDDEETDEDESENEAAQPTKKNKKLLVTAIILAIVLALSAAAVLFYQFFYLQTIHDMVVSGTEDKLTVTLSSKISDELLTVKCTDTHGNSLTAEVVDGVAQFTGLRPGTAYKLEVRINGFHKLNGDTSETYTTATQTIITGFYAATGPEDGSVILSFTPQGPTSQQWTVKYSTPGEEEMTRTFNGHMVTITGLTIGKEYTFKLEPVTNLYISGTDTITHTASSIIYAENLEIVGFVNGNLVISWNNPEGITVPQWYVRCYNDSGYDQTLTTAETSISFTGLSKTGGYTIEVTADGMTLGARISLSDDSVFINKIQADGSDRKNLKVTWSFDGDAPEGGWLLSYTIDGNSDRQVITCNSNSATITPMIPGAHYSISVTTASGVSVFGGNLEIDTVKASSFSGFSVKAKNMEFSMCKTPKKNKWDKDDVSKSSYTTTFKVGESASFVMHLDKKTDQTNDVVVTLYVIRDAAGQLISYKHESRTWDDMWDNRYGELTIPTMPTAPGNYTVEIPFDGGAVLNQAFAIVG